MKWDPAKLEEVTLSSTQLFAGKIISLHMEEVRLPDGQHSKREIVKHPGAVAVVAIDRDRLLVVAQYRKALGKIQVEIPAGKLEPNEDLQLAAGRELEEETGYRAQSLRHLCSFYTSPGFADEILHLYFTDDIVNGDANPDADEFIESDFLTFAEATDYVQRGIISDAKTMMAMFVWNMYRSTGQPWFVSSE